LREQRFKFGRLRHDALMITSERIGMLQKLPALQQPLLMQISSNGFFMLV